MSISKESFANKWPKLTLWHLHLFFKLFWVFFYVFGATENAPTQPSLLSSQSSCTHMSGAGKHTDVLTVIFWCCPSPQRRSFNPRLAVLFLRRTQMAHRRIKNTLCLNPKHIAPFFVFCFFAQPFAPSEKLLQKVRCPKLGKENEEINKVDLNCEHLEVKNGSTCLGVKLRLFSSGEIHSLTVTSLMIISYKDAHCCVVSSFSLLFLVSWGRLSGFKSSAARTYGQD